MSALIGEILEISEEDGQLSLRVQTGTNQEVTAIFLQPPNIDTSPIAGDSVCCFNIGQEWVALASDDGQRSSSDGEIKIYSRDSNDTIKGCITIDNSGKVDINGHLTIESL